MSICDFRDQIETVTAGMLNVVDSARRLPMSHTAYRNNSKGLFSQVTGSVVLATDRARLQEQWNMVPGAWFDGGIDDPDLPMLALTNSGGEVWVSPTSGIRLMCNIAKARLTGSEPAMVGHFTL